MPNAREARTIKGVAKLLPRVERRRKAKPVAHHVSAEFLVLHVLGDLPIFQRAEVEEHLSGCGACRAEFQHLCTVIAVFRTPA
jgi:hypothetical protein